MATFKTIYTTKGENPASIINELSKIEEDVVKLYLPEYAGFFEDRSNFELLKREADFLGKEIIILTLDKDGMAMAEAAGFSTQAPVRNEGASREEAIPEIRQIPVRKDDEKTGPRRFVDISSAGKRSLSDLEPVSPQETVSLEALEKEGSLDYGDSSSDDFDAPETEESLEREQELDTFLNERKENNTNGHIVRRRPSFSGWYKWRFLGLGAVVVIALYLLFSYLPKANITVISARQPVNFDANITVDKNLTKVNQDANMIPGQILEITKTVSQQFSASGAAPTSGKVQGTIRVYNEQTTAQSMIPSRFQVKSNGKIYWSQKSIVIPAATKDSSGKLVPGKLDVLVVAAEAGTGSALKCSVSSPCLFSVPAWRGTDRFSKVYAQATADLTGGTAAGSKVITADDMKAAQASIQNALKQAAKDDFTKTLASGLRLIPESISVDVKSINTDKAVGAVADSFTVKATGDARAVAVSDQDVKTYVDETVQSKLSQDKMTYPDTISVNFKDVAVNIEKGQVQVALSATEQVGWQFSVSDLRNQFRGKSRDQLNNLVNSMDKIASIKVNLWPIWVSKVPNRLSRINVTVE